MPAPDHLIRIKSETLSDGSVVWNVEVPAMTLNARSEDGADDLADEIVSAIRVHTNATADMITE